MTSIRYKEKINNLISSGLSLQESADIMNCSVGKIYYYAKNNPDYKTKRRFNLKDMSSEDRKVFLCIRARYHALIKRRNHKIIKPSFSFREFLEHIKRFKTCYLTGREIDLKNLSEWELDHIIPVKYGGDNTLDNLRPCIKWANQMKSFYSVEEFKNRCEIIYKNLCITTN